MPELPLFCTGRGLAVPLIPASHFLLPFLPNYPFLLVCLPILPFLPCQVGGQRLYDAARKGKEVERQARMVTGAALAAVTDYPPAPAFAEHIFSHQHSTQD